MYQRGEFEKAIQDYDEAIRLDPRSSRAFLGRGAARCGQREYDKAIADFTESIRLDPKSALAYRGRGTARYEAREYDKAIADYTEAIKLDPRDASSFNNRGGAWHSKGDHDRAIADYSEAIRLSPKDADYYLNRGLSWTAKAKWDAAIKDFNRAHQIDPKNSKVLESRGITRNRMGDYEGALADYTEAIRLDPKFARAYSNRALIRAECLDATYRDGAKALADAKRACELAEWKEPHYLSVLAAAYAESGDYPAAVKWLKKALEDTAYRKREGERGRNRLKLYESKLPRCSSEYELEGRATVGSQPGLELVGPERGGGELQLPRRSSGLPSYSSERVDQFSVLKTGRGHPPFGQ